MQITACRACGSPLTTTMIDLGSTPLANGYLRREDLLKPEPTWPLRAVVCEACRLVQLDHVADARAIFSEYAYFSSYSDSWLEHARRYVDHVVERFAFDASTQVVEIASNDGYLLQYFVARGIPVIGIEPAANVAQVAVAAGIPTRVMFFNSGAAGDLVRDGIRADLIVANNVLAHVPDLNDFVRGIARLLDTAGIVTFEFPHLLRLLQERQFDTIYHEHFSYFSLLSVERLLSRHGLSIFDVQQLSTHGGSLRLFVQHSAGAHDVTPAVRALRQMEQDAGLDDADTYRAFGAAVEALRDSLRRFVLDARAAGKHIAAYGAPAKGNTLLNYCGRGSDVIDLTVDRNPHKQNHYLPGSRIPVRDVEGLREARPDYVLLLPWNLKDEIVSQVGWIREWGGRFVVPVPEVTVLP
jgi:SAM-dependent methyltransferase